MYSALRRYIGRHEYSDGHNENQIFSFVEAAKLTSSLFMFAEFVKPPERT